MKALSKEKVAINNVSFIDIHYLGWKGVVPYGEPNQSIK
tara:strand:- start:8154 stop:8270 length:117 start_codon:yes stop_codon:yes gene_type:complete